MGTKNSIKRNASKNNQLCNSIFNYCFKAGSRPKSTARCPANFGPIQLNLKYACYFLVTRVGKAGKALTSKAPCDYIAKFIAIEVRERRQFYSGKKKKVLKQAMSEHEMTYERPFEVIDYLT